MTRLLQRWINRRLPPERAVRLGHQNVFILPTRWGMMFLLTVLLVLVAGINYQNSMILATAFLFFAVFVVHMHISFNNITGLQVSFHDAAKAHAGSEADVTLHVEPAHRRSGRGTHTVIQIGWPDNTASIRYQSFSLAGAQSSPRSLRLPLAVTRRGRHKAPRLLITSVFPLGLIRVWSWLDLDIEVLVYPQSISGQPVDSASEHDGEADDPARTRAESPVDFDGLREYQVGEPLSRIAWKKYAQHGALYTKVFNSESGDPVWIDMNNYGGRDLELQLSNVCAEVLARHEAGQPFGLKLGDWQLAPASGAAHLGASLEALALYPALDRDVTHA